MFKCVQREFQWTCLLKRTKERAKWGEQRSPLVTMTVRESHSKTSGNNAAMLWNASLCSCHCRVAYRDSTVQLKWIIRYLQRKEKWGKEEKNSSRYRGAQKRIQWQLVTGDGRRECARVLLLLHHHVEPLTARRTITRFYPRSLLTVTFKARTPNECAC